MLEDVAVILLPYLDIFTETEMLRAHRDLRIMRYKSTKKKHPTTTKSETHTLTHGHSENEKDEQDLHGHLKKL
jgi:hypothetical protein